MDERAEGEEIEGAFFFDVQASAHVCWLIAVAVPKTAVTVMIECFPASAPGRRSCKGGRILAKRVDLAIS
jgi:hypothetical protein